MSRGFDPSDCSSKPLVSYQINRQLSGWILPPLVIRAVGAHRKATTYRKIGTTNKRSADERDVRIGQRLRTRRMELKISQQELGQVLGVSFQQIQKYEKGVNRVGAARLVQLAEALDTNTGYFIGELEKGRGHESEFGEFMATREGVAIIEAMMTIDEERVRRLVIDIARALGELCKAA
ncbi:transcriptional regulator with XRE-family HTH domain [Bradyrhizobium japonicum]|uniref:helix-turn-helix domain-containing protein n=3 Tax=Bradyrhizobium TaxID=374 RepID=UPI00209FE9C7|nr:helix-turn-helix transcriptional regulator [Bradyrhizobium japonicum]WLC00048.1 helix-turn-helix transcriptional regulator [Bradyrhizobium japonicum USDA 123]MCP1744344.1 transcriptional regulator with XRE-family HTH domain [Bradyrhizobium japonicum]MCP1782625.1 transcriptional regulator with XRE-family HTH domain [Bradyrhizobium japonicum]MCP1892816.1 transcriptional regulator with XRE-family HTH domain [Bradyrhizobium japonicum]MCP1965085.1 transcriptional regulator with XRE-family HTH do